MKIATWNIERPIKTSKRNPAIIACLKEVNLERFQSWELRRVEGNTFFIYATDGNRNRVAKQKIPFSDFSYDTATLWLVDGCLMLPNEY